MSTERKAFLWLLGAWTLANAAFVLLTPFCLVGDEAQYWDWSRRPALGYYSKPPLIAYIVAGFVAVGGNKEWVVRSGAVALPAVAWDDSAEPVGSWVKGRVSTGRAGLRPSGFDVAPPGHSSPPWASGPSSSGEGSVGDVLFRPRGGADTFPDPFHGLE